ncbi:TIGR02530 family flagellar biosynthesis protein [Acetivibrio ethanolgignens]|uniref:Flagellar protein n=1 Tax=Acetivibrio ethanolgignens TaxID=290052 RepID=A0A0V8QJK3_9FIRM|nr:TIGR02530 family flagellar biosynthesis protein [Acetivibrio ethanolgignens]KSV60741.1 flagellar protein [Acetivibrio ethanolgignens]
MNIMRNKFSSIEEMTGKLHNSQANTRNAASLSKGQGISFQEVLEKTKATEESRRLRFSKHANERLQSRNIDLSKTQLERLEQGTNKAREKGIKESLVMVDDLAFIVNVKNNTVVTAVNNSEDGVFTNIDGAVIG